MNKKMRILLSAIVAVALVLAMSVTAFAAAPSWSVTQEGNEVRVTVKVTDGGLQADVNPSANLTYKGVEGGFGATANKLLIVSSMTGDSVTYIYEVSGEAGDAFSVAFTNVRSSDDTGATSTPEADFTAKGEIAGAVEPEPTPSEQPSEQPSEEPSEQPSEQPSEEPSEQPSEEPAPSDEQPAPSAQPSDSTSQDELDDVPKTGDATTDAWVWIAVAIVAGATIAVIAGKKVAARK